MISTKEAATRLNVSTRTVQYWCNNGLLISTKTPGGHRRIEDDSIEKLVQNMSLGSEDIPSSTRKVLNLYLVDDDPAFLKLLNLNIRKWNLPIKIFSACDGYQALIEMGHHKPELLITDLSMPGMDGYHMLDVIQNSAILESTQTCILSGSKASNILRDHPQYKNITIIEKSQGFEQVKLFLLKALTKQDYLY